ncbi:unnamed protein product (macronuclear) [Paramecium tetraurelia]|uniref:Uncharacterized protein n=1 Tax=Paramecium tetraurelia TaxID=5888 RepID=A0CIP1_PARTE|nr:uncharacterized protein GSPATT00007793001 [Paramecium tetraurelia]CAK70658.1 unnamed protein product [Paramecium tetraurelia]|eukprot:XP_001438055.1 hypothetical protein (macronuclear) [Paramecium tetraurelia strain d4-2]
MEVNYPELVEDYNLFITTGERYVQEFLQKKALQYALFQIQENLIIEQHLSEKKNKKVQIKQSRIQTIRYKCLNFLDIQINLSLKDKKLAINMKADDCNITNFLSMEQLIKITHELQIGYTQDELIVNFTLKNHQECREDKSVLFIDKNVYISD